MTIEGARVRVSQKNEREAHSQRRRTVGETDLEEAIEEKRSFVALAPEGPRSSIQVIKPLLDIHLEMSFMAMAIEMTVFLRVLSEMA